MSTIKAENNNEELSMFAKALAHPTRLQILQYLNVQSSCLTGELVDILPIAQSTISQHLKELKKAGLINGEVDPPRIKYCINRINWERAKKIFCEFLEFDTRAESYNL